jgi:hypothetical protein
MPAAELPACVFCGEPIDPGEEAAGRAPMAAHAACADAALADDAHWEAIDAAGTEGESHAPDPGTAARAGCLGVMALCVVALAVAWRASGR